MAKPVQFLLNSSLHPFLPSFFLIRIDYWYHAQLLLLPTHLRLSPVISACNSSIARTVQASVCYVAPMNPFFTSPFEKRLCSHCGFVHLCFGHVPRYRPFSLWIHFFRLELCPRYFSSELFFFWRLLLYYLFIMTIFFSLSSSFLPSCCRAALAFSSSLDLPSPSSLSTLLMI